MTTFRTRCAVVAFGGNALSRPDRQDTIYDQFAQTRKSLEGIVELLKAGFNVAITHGNAPQVGAALRRVELAAGDMPSIPLGMLVAETQGSIGYMIEQSLQNRLVNEGIQRHVVSIITQVLVDENDPALKKPTKFIGRIFTRKEAQDLIKNEGWTMSAFAGDDQWRRVVGSPKPLGILNRKAIRALIQEGVVVIAGGGGGIPVYRDPRLGYEGVDAVVDKDRVAAILAHDIEAEELFILTNVDCVKLNFGKSDEKPIREMRVRQAKKYIEDGQFPAGSMGPKVEASLQFVELGGQKAVICALEDIGKAMRGESGTVILP